MPLAADCIHGHYVILSAVWELKKNFESSYNSEHKYDSVMQLLQKKLSQSNERLVATSSAVAMQWRREVVCEVVRSHRAATCRGGTLTARGNFFNAIR